MVCGRVATRRGPYPFLMIRRPPRSTPLYSSAASDVYKCLPSILGAGGLNGRVRDGYACFPSAMATRLGCPCIPGLTPTAPVGASRSAGDTGTLRMYRCAGELPPGVVRTPRIIQRLAARVVRPGIRDTSYVPVRVSCHPLGPVSLSARRTHKAWPERARGYGTSLGPG